MKKDLRYHEKRIQNQKGFKTYRWQMNLKREQIMAKGKPGEKWIDTLYKIYTASLVSFLEMNSPQSVPIYIPASSAMYWSLFDLSLIRLAVIVVLVCISLIREVEYLFRCFWLYLFLLVYLCFCGYNDAVLFGPIFIYIRLCRLSIIPPSNYTFDQINIHFTPII